MTNEEALGVLYDLLHKLGVDTAGKTLTISVAGDEGFEVPADPA